MTNTISPTEQPHSRFPLVTCALVCWNHQQFAREAVLSAYNQTYRNIEIVVYNNGSTDRSAEVLTELQAELGPESFTLVHQENVGIVGALNRGLARARGSYLSVLSCDDSWLPDKIERQVRFLERHREFDMLCGRLEFIDQSGKSILGISDPFQSGEVDFHGLMTKGNSVYGPTVMLRTSAAREIGGYDPSCRIEDYGMALAFTSRGRRIYRSNEIFTRYRRHESNWTTRALYDDHYQLGLRYRTHPDFPAYLRRNLSGYFGYLAERSPRRAFKYISETPEAWTISELGRGVAKLIFPRRAIQLFRSVRRKAHF